MKGAIQKDQNDVSFVDIHKPFTSLEDAVKKLVSYHVYSEPEPNAKMQRKGTRFRLENAVHLSCLFENYSQFVYTAI